MVNCICCCSGVSIYLTIHCTQCCHSVNYISQPGMICTIQWHELEDIKHQLQPHRFLCSHCWFFWRPTIANLLPGGTGKCAKFCHHFDAKRTLKYFTGKSLVMRREMYRMLHRRICQGWPCSAKLVTLLQMQHSYIYCDFWCQLFEMIILLCLPFLLINLVSLPMYWDLEN